MSDCLVSSGLRQFRGSTLRARASMASSQPITNPPKTRSNTSNTDPENWWRSMIAPTIRMTAQTTATAVVI